MDTEFHYYWMYLIASKAGYPADEAYVIAYSSQHVDHNNAVFTINEGEASQYCNYISQTMNILKPKHKLFRIYPVFHFFPGEPQDRRAWRKDGKMHWLTTPPNSENADRMLEAALATEDLYRIGIACHAFADSWAHQNVTGYYEEYKAIIENLLDKILKKQLLIHIAKRVG